MKYVLVFFLLMGLFSCKDSNKGNKNTPQIITVTDSIISVDSSIAGNQIIKDTEGQLTSWELAGYWLKRINVSECRNEGEPYPIESNKIIEQIKTDSVFRVKFNTWEICGSNFLFDVNVVNKNTLNLIYIPYNSWASCRCNCQIEYVFKLIDDGGESYPYQIKYFSINDEKQLFDI